MSMHFGSDIEPLIMSKDDEMADWLPSPYCLSPSEKARTGSINSPKGHSVAEMEELLFSRTTFSSELDQVYSSSICMHLHHDSSQWTAYPCEHSDFQLNDFPRFEEADETFLHSLIEANGSGIQAAASVNLSPTSSKGNEMPSNLLRDLTSESYTVQDHIDSMGHSKDLKTYTFPAPSCSNKANGDPFSLAKAMAVDIPSSLKHNLGGEQIAEKTSLGESAYLELRSLTVMLSENTRICLRDAMYRLAENSKYEETNSIVDGNEASEEFSQTTNSEASRLDDTETEESTNAIDRTVANLLFNNINFSTH